MLQASATTTTISAFFTILLACLPAHATPHKAHPGRGRHAATERIAERRHSGRFARSGVIQCVAFAKTDAGIDIAGNARDWWGNAAGVYERGARPETGSVLSFRANGRMPLGHVAVVSGIEDSRTIIIDQSHWASRGITRDIVVKDVSDDNDWTSVRVELGHGGGFGNIYPTHGFIYPRSDSGTMVASAASPEPKGPAMHAIEIAEAPENSRPLDLSLEGIASDAPSRTLR